MHIRVGVPHVQAVKNCTPYCLRVNWPSGNVLKQWYTSDQVTSGSTCSVTPALTLSSGEYTWWVRTFNSAGYGPWSDGMQFNVGS
ncbi:MAG TPA: hypothetical protein VN455_04885 [Methanotrichaceae archaeon]|nr:hypothetical protein [Methanotrichaceae archaeon]